MKKTRLAAILLASLALILALSALMGSAKDGEYFTVINDNIRPLSVDTMPVMKDGEIYAPYTIFDDRSLGVYYSYNQDKYALTLYNRDYTLTFDSPAQVAYDRDQQYPIKMTTNAAGAICVPLRFVCEKFGLTFQEIQTHPIATIRVVSTSTVDVEGFREARQAELVAMYLEYITPPSVEPSDDSTASGTGDDIESDEPRIVYITFDDGPNHNTSDIMDTLDEYGMKATFFLLGSQIEKERDTIRRMVGEGHAVGLHAWSHVDSEMYSSSEALLDEIERASDALDAVAQVRTRFFRFPYGSSYKEVTESMRDAVIGAGYRYWDWTVDALDYEQESASTLARTVIRGIEKADSTIVILMHDTEKTAEALPEILEYISEGNFVTRTISIGDMPMNFYGDVRTSLTD